MKNERKSIRLVGGGFLLCGLLGLNGCDYWPPALQTEIEALRADLEAAMDERQQLTVELAELRTTRASMEQEVDEKARRNNELEQRLAALALKQKERLVSARAEARAAAQRAAVRTTRRAAPASRSPIVQGSFSPMRVTNPVIRGAKVVQLQRLLLRHDLPVRVDGIYGSDTAAAVRWYQRRHGLPADGIVGPATYRSLRRAEPAARLVRQLGVQRPPLKGQDVASVQRALRRAGYRIAIDGRFGPTTETALMRFQRKHGLRADGVVGPRTWAFLKK